jgi:hypothetical protein
MKRKLLTIAFYFLTLNASYAATRERGVDVRASGRELFETKPKEIVTTTFRITNTTENNQEFVSEVELPDEWVLITEDFPFELGPNESTTKLISFFVPETTSVGKYKITYLISARKYPVIRDFYTVEVVVLPQSKLEVKLLEAPQYVIAGEDYEVSFSVTNKGNTENTVSLKVDSSENIPFTVDAQTFKLAAEQSKIVTVRVKPDAKVKNILRHRLQLTAQISKEGELKTQAKAAHSVEIIPRSSTSEEPLSIIAAEAALRELKLPQTQLDKYDQRYPTFASAKPEAKDELTPDKDILKKKIKSETAIT